MSIFTTLVAGFASAWGLRGKQMGSFPIGNIALGLLAVLLVLGIVGFLGKQAEHKNDTSA